ncbi:hypothetical protein SAMN04488120_11142 [Fontimonas thermophila]|uniref:Lipoprotein n=1 Tax=Fontimonas thermophila TaxID=1076937 RepID=A0A1I2JY41_9GAMM|nr:hypothetical protein [Fontimonas thermophila]SFF59755.1 hypothetical protein SAMN04488120_11142 [Fontimonas thermophila]
MKRLFLFGSALLLSACGSGDSRDGIHAEVSALHHTHDAAMTTAHTANYAPKHSTSNYKTFRREDGMRIDLQRGLLGISPVALEPCGIHAAALVRKIADALLPAAHAHGGETHDTGDFIDVLEPDLNTIVDLGSLPAEPGEYCGLVVELLPAPAGTQIGTDDGPLDIGGQSIVVSPCYYPNTVGVPELPAERTADNAPLFAHECIDAAYGGPALRTTLAFETPVTLNGEHRHLEVTVGVIYDRWFEGIAMDRLASDTAEQGRFAQQVLASLHVHAVGDHAD